MLVFQPKAYSQLLCLSFKEGRIGEGYDMTEPLSLREDVYNRINQLFQGICQIIKS